MNADQWYFTKEDLLDTPSILDGITHEQEQMDRIKGCHYLLSVGAKLNLTQLALVSATTFFHRFFMRQSMKYYHVYDIAATCLFVATKVEECTRRIKDIVVACAQKAQKNDKLELKEDSKDFIKWKDTLLRYEVILLETLCFDLAVQHPHSVLLESNIQRIVPVSTIKKAWIFLYQSVGAPFCVLYRPNTIAAAALLLGISYSTERPDDSWWNYVNVDAGQVHQLAAEMIDYFTEHFLKRAPTATHPPQTPSSQTSIH